MSASTTIKALEARLAERDRELVQLRAEIDGLRASPGRGELLDKLDKLESSQRFTQSILDNVPVAIAYLDHNLIYRQCNLAAAHEVGRPVEQVLGRSLHELFPANGKLWEAIERVLRTGEPFHSPEFPVTWPDRPDEGTQYYVVAYSPDRDPAGGIRGVFAEWQRITELAAARRQFQTQADHLAVQAGELLQQTEQLAARTAELEAAKDALATSKEQYRALSRRLVEALEAQQRNIARELHDEASQALSALKLGLGQVKKDVSHAETVVEHIERLLGVTDSVMEDLHRLAMSLRPISLDRYGLVPAVHQYVASYKQETGLDVELVVSGLGDERLPSEVETTAYRVVQETLTNAARHAKATRIGVILERRSDRLVAIVEDNGKGFNVEEAVNCGRLGLLGMRERAEMLGGSLTIESAPGKGTAVYVELPLRPA